MTIATLLSWKRWKQWVQRCVMSAYYRHTGQHACFLSLYCLPPMGRWRHLGCFNSCSLTAHGLILYTGLLVISISSSWPWPIFIRTVYLFFSFIINLWDLLGHYTWTWLNELQKVALLLALSMAPVVIFYTVKCAFGITDLLACWSELLQHNVPCVLAYIFFYYCLAPFITSALYSKENLTSFSSRG